MYPLPSVRGVGSSMLEASVRPPHPTPLIVCAEMRGSLPLWDTAGWSGRVYTPCPARNTRFPLSDAVSQEASVWLRLDSHPESDTHGAAQRVAPNETTTIIIHSPPAPSMCPLFTGACPPDSERRRPQLQCQRNHYEITNETTTAHCSLPMLKRPNDAPCPSP